MLRIVQILGFSLISLSVFSQSGTIGGRIIDHKTTEGVIGANVVIEGTSVGAATDLDGNFQINTVKPGTYTLVVSSITYKTQTIADVVVEGGNKTSLEITLVEDVAELKKSLSQPKKKLQQT